MSARRHLHLLLVASLIVILFALAPAKAEESNLDIVEIEHLNSKEQNKKNFEKLNKENVTNL